MLSSQSDHTHAVRDDSVQGIALNGDLGNLEVRFSVSSPKQSDGATRTDGKQQMGFSGTGSRGNRSNGGKGSKSLKRQHPSSSSQKATSSKNLQCSENGGILSGSKQSDKQPDKVWLGDLAPEQASRGSRQDHPSNKESPTKELGWCDAGMGPVWKNIFPITPESRRTGKILLDHLA